MPFAVDNTISNEPLEGGVEITSEQYQEALVALSEGKRISVKDGILSFPSAEKHTLYSVTGEETIETYVDEPIPEGFTTLKRPDVDYTWVEGNWVRPLSISKELKRKELNRLRDSEEAAGFIFKDELFDSDERSVLRITTTALTAQRALDYQQPFSIEWTTAENNKVVLTAEEVLMLPYHLALHAQALHAKCSALKNLVEAATTIEEVEAITWETVVELPN